MFFFFAHSLLDESYLVFSDLDFNESLGLDRVENVTDQRCAAEVALLGSKLLEKRLTKNDGDEHGEQDLCDEIIHDFILLR